jgi:hypothetical protein
MITLIAAAALAAQPAPSGPPPAEHKVMDCCKDCCKDMAKGHDAHDMSDRQGHPGH